jgi:hypothetical protein
MMGRLKSDQGQLFYEFRLGDAVPEDHMVRKIDTALDLSWLRSELAPHYSSIGRPSIDPELMIRMLIIGYVDINSIPIRFFWIQTILQSRTTPSFSVFNLKRGRM